MKPANGQPRIEDYYFIPHIAAASLGCGARNYSDFEDACQEGMMGLCKAFRDRREGCSEVSFKSYANMKVKGAILDYLRKQDPLSRTKNKFTQTDLNFRNPDSLDKHFEEDEDCISGHERVPDNNALAPDSPYIADSGLLYAAVDSLPEMQRKVLALYYFEGLRLREIGDAFDLTESRICQIHAQGILSLQQFFRRDILQNNNGSCKRRGISIKQGRRVL